jgi:ABC-type nitrate/sulfonate/bicarbonate transport system ATPase subunit
MPIEDLHFSNKKASNLNLINILLGRNGVGKSTYLREIDAAYSRHEEFNSVYISPERSGSFKREGHIITNIENNISWLSDDRRKNQTNNFKAGSAHRLREAETIYLRRLQDDPVVRLDPSRNFKSDCLDKINRLLSNISIVQEDANFIFRTAEGGVVQPEMISSGESEAVALASEIFYFFLTVKPEKINILLLDEPDVHLHPDLQARLGHFLLGMFEGIPAEISQKVTVILSTHSSPFVAGLASSSLVSIGTKEFSVNEVFFSPVGGRLKKVFPFFGHPLSLSLSQDVMLILEGEDDERVWQQAARSSEGRIKLFPVLASSVDQQSELETFCAPLLESLYDKPLAFSLRDGDGTVGSLNSIGPLVRYRMECYAIENCLVTKEALSVLQITWGDFITSAKIWLDRNTNHKDVQLINALISSGDRLRHRKIKAIRQLICSISNSTKPWEVVVGQAIARVDPLTLSDDPFGIADFIGRKAVVDLLSHHSG